MPRPSDDDDIAKRVASLKDSNDIDPSELTEEDLNARFKAVFGHEPLATKKNLDYSIPDKYSNEFDDNIEVGFGSSDEDEDYLTDILGTGPEVSAKANTHNIKLDAAVNAFLGEDDHTPSAEEHDIVRQVREEIELEKKYKDLHGDSDDILEKRFAAFSKDVKDVLQNAKPAVGSSSPVKYNRVYVPPPKPFEEDEEDETEGWCCICNEDGTIICIDCDDDVYCNNCFKEGHQGPNADFDLRSHKWKRYTKRRNAN
ncbi:hypothetical protein BGW37DRAFT_478106 [Umbelopsis sp. PMI_123]|nr:hypothetical protein BGW37DRAFT_478106 [Umbelopsis sp. PMI_123]